MAEAIVPASAPTPVMDVVAPPADKEEKHGAPVKQTDPVDALAAADKRAQDMTGHGPKDKDGTKHVERTPTKPQEVTSSNGVGLAITATVVIVFGLAILAVYAYTQTNK